MSVFSSMVFSKKAAAIAVAFFFMGGSLAMAQDGPPSAGIRFDPKQPGCVVYNEGPPLACDFDSFIGTPVVSLDKTQFGTRPLRIIHEGDMVTQDFSPDRITITLDADENILKMTCG